MKRALLILPLFWVCLLAQAQFQFDRYLICRDQQHHIGIMRDELEGCLLSMTEWQIATHYHYEVLAGKQFAWVPVSPLKHYPGKVVTIGGQPICLTRLRPKNPIYYLGIGQFYEREGYAYFNCRGINMFNPKARYQEANLLNGEERVSDQMVTTVLVAKKRVSWFSQAHVKKGFSINQLIKN